MHLYSYRQHVRGLNFNIDWTPAPGFFLLNYHSSAYTVLTVNTKDPRKAT